MAQEINGTINGTNGERYIRATRELMFAWLVRLLMTVSVTVGGPLAYFILHRIVSTADDIAASVHAHDMSLEILKEQGKEIKDLVGDHETRIRTLERRPTFAPR